MFRTLRGFVALASAGILITVGGCADQPTATADLESQFTRVTLPGGASYSVAGSGPTSRQTVGPEGGTLTSGAHSLTFPAGALSQPTEITMTAHPGAVAVELQPHGLLFPAASQPLLTLNFAGSNAYQFSRLLIAYQGPSGRLEEIFATTVSGTTVSARIPHFSGYWNVGN